MISFSPRRKPEITMYRLTLLSLKCIYIIFRNVPQLTDITQSLDVNNQRFLQKLYKTQKDTIYGKFILILNVVF